MTEKNEKSSTSLIHRSVPQVISAHLPGSIKSINDMFYKMEDVIVGADQKLIKEIIYNDLLNNIYEWFMFFFKDNDSAEPYQLSNLVNIESKIQINKDFTFNMFQQVKGFQEKDFAVSEVLDSEENNSFTSNTLQHKGNYFPFTWKCSNCNILMYSKKIPSRKCKCDKKSWKQLNIALVSTSAKFFDLKSIKEEKNANDGFLKCSICKSPIKIKEKHNLSQYRLICSHNINHLNHIDEPNYTLYSLYSNSLFNPLKNEIVNFNQQALFFEKKSKLIYDIIQNKRLVANNDRESEVLEWFVECFDKYNEKSELRRNNLKSSLNKIEIIPNLKNTINNLINTNKIIPEAELLNFYHKQILDKISEKSMEILPQKDNQLFAFEKIGLLNDIQVINYTYGFSRISDKAIITQTGLVKLRFFYRTNQTPQSSTSTRSNDDNVKQVYFTQESNKGIYFKLNTEKLEKFLRSKLPLDDKSPDNKINELKFIYLHSLCHYLIRMISQNFSGISTSSLTELIFPEECAFLIYKKGTGKELGYLESFFNNCIRQYGDKYEEFWEEVNNANNLFCPASEICENACIECLMISKHSCKHHNEKLDRKILIN